ncbi:MAG: hypothetical protein E5W88_29985, partial [Mesorhizobium sp.]
MPPSRPPRRCAATWPACLRSIRAESDGDGAQTRHGHEMSGGPDIVDLFVIGGGVNGAGIARDAA